MKGPGPAWSGRSWPAAGAIMEGLAGFLRLDTVSQNPGGVRAGGEWLARAMRGSRARGPGDGDWW